jgi:hypothetical protein
MNNDERGASAFEAAKADSKAAVSAAAAKAIADAAAAVDAAFEENSADAAAAFEVATSAFVAAIEANAAYEADFPVS